MKNINTVLYLVFALLLSGCAGPTIHLSPASRQNIHSVTVDPKIPVPSAPEYRGGTLMGNSVAASTGMIGALIQYAAESSSRDAIAKSMSNDGIKLDQQLYQKFTQKLKEQTNFKLAVRSSGDAQFQLVVNGYGFANDPLSSVGAVPYINVTGQLVDTQGNILWEKTKKEYLVPSMSIHYKFKDYINSPELMRKAFNTLSDQAADDLVFSLNQ